MIISADKWQIELKSLCDRLLTSYGATEDDLNDFEFEKCLYYIVICLRKLNDTVLWPKTLGFYGWQLQGCYYYKKNDFESTMWWFAIEKNFAMDKPSEGTASLKDVVDMIIHSKYLSCCFSRNTLIVGSDRECQNSQFIFEFSRDKFLNYCQRVIDTEYEFTPPPSPPSKKSSDTPT